jgi:hypothetical protein
MNRKGDKMKKVLWIIILALVLGTYCPSFGAEKANETGRFQVVPATQDMVLLVDTATGQAWIFSTDIKDGKHVSKWVPVAFTKNTILPENKNVWVEK